MVWNKAYVQGLIQSLMSNYHVSNLSYDKGGTGKTLKNTTVMISIIIAII